MDRNIQEITKVVKEKRSMDKRVLYEKYIAMFKVTERFIQQKNLLVYGGLALNWALPKHKRFYDEYELPDYDFFSYDARTHAVELADIYHREGYKYIEVRPGIHYATYKVFVDFQAVADITDIPIKLFEHLLQISMEERPMILKHNPTLDVNIAPLSLLRLSFHIELSRPNGFIERWEKIYSRMILFYHNYPLLYAPCKEIFIDETNTRLHELKRVVINYCKTHKLPMLGLEAVKTYMWYNGTKVPDSHILDPRMPLIEIVCLKYRQETTSLMNLLKSMCDKTENIVAKHHAALNKSELIPKHQMIYWVNEDGIQRPLVCIYNSQACYAFKLIEGVMVLSIDSLLSFFYSYIFTNREYYNIDKIKCIINILLNLQHKHLFDNKYVWRRFGLECYGNQPQLEDVKRERWGRRQTFQIYRPDQKKYS